MKALSIAVAMSVAALPQPGSAEVITPVSVEASSTFRTYDKNNLIDGSGLDTSGLHDSSFGNMWMTDLGEPTGVLTFDLGGLYSLDSASLWQYNFGTNTPVISTLDRGVDRFRILTSVDGVTYDEVFSGNMTRSPDGSPVGAQVFSLAPVDARFVQLDLLSNFSIGTIYEDSYPIGLSEVRFGGSVAGAVPEPTTWLLLVMGIGAVGAAMRRKKVSIAYA
ncbi:PEPxxWA-CTERM sorting domain-containing protein [Qipengyuania sp.]|uniref:PEPxxWA-CTERM sorting domain-containing protein n=1 Tax=Qipengyuania sp. TaxID=2004515 RepID=UPI0035C85FCE